MTRSMIPAITAPDRMAYEWKRQFTALNHHAIVSIADAGGGIIYINDLFCDVSGYSREELLGQNHRVVKSGCHPPAFFRDMWTTIRAGQVWKGEICNRRKDGTLYWVESTITPFMDDEGVPYQFVSIRTDITHVRAAQQWIEQQSRLQSCLAEQARALLAVEGDDIWPAIHTALGEIGQAFDAQGCAVLDFDAETGLQCRASWQPDIPDVSTPLDCSPVVLQSCSGDSLESCLLSLQRMMAGKCHQLSSLIGLEGESPYCLMLSIPPSRGHKTELNNLLDLFADMLSNVLRRAAVLAELTCFKERLRSGQVHANIGTWEWDLDNDELYWSEKIGPLLGYGESDVVEASHDQFIRAVHPCDVAKVEAAITRSLEDDAPYDVEHRVVLPNGEERWLLERGAVVRNDAGKPLRMIGVMQDITDRVEAYARLRETEERFTFAVEGAGDGVWDWDMASGRVTFSRLYMAMLGYDEHELPHHIDTWIGSVHPDDWSHVSQQLDGYMSGVFERYEVELRLKRKDGGWQWVLCRGTIVEHDDTGLPQRMIGIHSNIGRNKINEQALISARNEAERANRAKSEFLSSMSHELRTPMNAILGFGQLMEYDRSLPVEHQESVHEILKAGRHLLDLINDILDLARVESGNMGLSMEPVDLGELLDECCSLINPLAQTAGVRLRCQMFKGVSVNADRTRLKQVMINLMSNGVKYNRRDGYLDIRVLPVANDRLRLMFTDNGCGISDEGLAQLFQPFNRLDAEQGSIEGTGIGLTLTQKMIQMMSGEIGVESRVGEGSTFWIELPAVDCLETASHGSSRAPAPVPSEVPALPDKVVLYIDDNPANIKLVRHLLARFSAIEVVDAHTPELGLELAKRYVPDLILLDINMPGMNGYQVLEVLQRNPIFGDTPVLALTANAMPRDIERGREAGFSDYLTKPLDVPAFLDRIATLLVLETDMVP